MLRHPPGPFFSQLNRALFPHRDSSSNSHNLACNLGPYLSNSEVTGTRSSLDNNSLWPMSNHCSLTNTQFNRPGAIKMQAATTNSNCLHLNQNLTQSWFYIEKFPRFQRFVSLKGQHSFFRSSLRIEEGLK